MGLIYLKMDLRQREMRALSLMYGQITTAKVVDGDKAERMISLALVSV